MSVENSLECTGQGSLAVLSCAGVWKVFGPGAEGLLKRGVAGQNAARMASSALVAAVANVSLSVMSGEIFCIMGLSGSGKSTLVRCMAGLLSVSQGTLTLLGLDLARATEAELVALRRTKISMVFQDFALLPHLTVLENIAFPLRVRGTPRPERYTTTRRLIRLVGLEGRERFYPHELSGGQQQRVGIARSLTTDPLVWFLDEPFSALDPLIRQDMQDELLRLHALLRKTIVFITHDFDEAIRLADRIAIMREGHVVQVANPEELVLKPADGYVARFTAKVAHADVVRVRTVMKSIIDPAGEAPLQASARIREVVSRVLDAGRPLAVADDNGRIVGSLSPASVIEVLAHRTAGAVA